MLEKKTVCDKVEVVNMDTIPMLQCREATWVEEDGVMIGGKQFSRHVIAPTDDVSGECAEVQAFAAALFTDEVKAAYAAKQAQETI